MMMEVVMGDEDWWLVDGNGHSRREKKKEKWEWAK
jgi:hypothetical protein